MLDFLKNHVIGYSTVLVVATTGITASVIQYLVISDLERQSQFYKGQATSFQSQVTAQQQTIAQIDASCERRTVERLDGLKEISSQKESLLKDTIKNLQTELNNARKLAAKFEETCRSFSELKQKISDIKAQESLASRELSKLLVELREKKKDYGFRSIECEKRGLDGGNICEHASAAKFEVEALEKAVSEKSAYLNNLSNQFVALSNLVNANGKKGPGSIQNN